MATTTGSVRLIDGMKFEGTASSGHTVMLDSAEAFGGENAGFRPMELLAISMAGCTAMDVVSLLRKMRQSFTDVEVSVEAGRAEEHPKVFTDVLVTYIIRGHDLDPSKVNRAVELSQEKYCSAIGTVRGVANVSARVEIVDEEAVA